MACLPHTDSSGRHSDDPRFTEREPKAQGPGRMGSKQATRLQRPPFDLHILLPPFNKLQYFSDLHPCGWKVISCCWGHRLKVMALVPGKGGADACTGLRIVTLPTHSKTT